MPSPGAGGVHVPWPDQHHHLAQSQIGRAPPSLASRCRRLLLIPLPSCTLQRPCQLVAFRPSPPVPPISALLRLAQGERDRSRVILYPCSSGQSGAAPRWRLRVSSNYPSPCPLLSLPLSVPEALLETARRCTSPHLPPLCIIHRYAALRTPSCPLLFYAQRLVTSRPCIKRCRY